MGDGSLSNFHLCGELTKQVLGGVTVEVSNPLQIHLVCVSILWEGRTSILALCVSDLMLVVLVMEQAVQWYLFCYRQYVVG